MNLELHLLATPVDRYYSPVQALQDWREFRVANGWSPRARLLSWPGSNIKVDKSDLPTLSNSLAPSTSGGHNVCSHSTPDCRRGCVAHEGNGRYEQTRNARALRVQFLYANPSAYVALMNWELHEAETKYGRIACRLNTFSDQPWEVIAPWLFTDHPECRFYDYTKNWSRLRLPVNYHLTYSVSERTELAAAIERVLAGHNIAVVCATKRGRPLPASWQDLPVVDGDASDARWADPAGVVVGLRAKGRLKGTSMVRG